LRKLTREDGEIVFDALTQLVLENPYDLYQPKDIFKVILSGVEDKKISGNWYREKVQRILSVLPETDVVKIKKGWYDLAPDKKRALVEGERNRRLQRIERAMVDPDAAEKMKQEEKSRNLDKLSKAQDDLNEFFSNKDSNK
jgi:hypothetical protein